MSEETQTFAWAYENDANINEPIEALKRLGWRYGDVPAASNFNWIFKRISDEFIDTKSELAAQKIQNQENQAQLEKLKDELFTLGQELTSTQEKIKIANAELSSHKAEIELNKTELETAKAKHESLKTTTKNRFERTFRNDDFNTGISRQICMALEEMERIIRLYHEDFPNLKWPLSSDVDEPGLRLG